MSESDQGSQQANTQFKTYVVFCFVDANKEQQLSNEEVDAEVLVDGVTIGLQTPQEAESGDADGQTHKGDDNSHPSDHEEDQFVHAALVLRRKKVQCEKKCALRRGSV